MQKPKVSVIIITYRRPHYLQRAIKSVLDQTYKTLELIVVDDASGDTTRQVVQQFHDERIRYIVHQSNKGEGEARNTGLQYVEGEYIAFLDDDDEWELNKLKMQVDVLEKSSECVAAVYTGLTRVDLDTEEVVDTKIPQADGDIYQELIQFNFIPPSVILIRRTCLEQIGIFDVKIPAGLDHDMWVRIAKQYQIRCIPQALVKYGMHTQKLSGNFDLQIRGRQMFLKKHRAWFQENQRSYSQLLQNLAILYFLSGEKQKGIVSTISSIKKYPWSFKNYILLGLGIVLGRRLESILLVNSTVKTFLRNYVVIERRAVDGRS